MAVTERTYEQVVLEDPDHRWELHDGRLREKPAMTLEHNEAQMELARQLLQQLDRAEFRVRIDNGRVRRPARSVYIPDVFVVPTAAVSDLRPRRLPLEIYDTPLPFVAEVWSPSTGGYDVDEKLPEYQRRGDREIWRVHPFDLTVTVWRRREDGAYEEQVYRGGTGTVRLSALPDVTIDLAALFEP